MHRTTTNIALYIAAALSGVAAAYVLNEWVLHWWDARHPPRVDDKPKTPPSSPRQDNPPTIEVVPTAEEPPVPEHADLHRDAHMPATSQSCSLPHLRTHSLPPPLSNGCAFLSGPPFAINPDAMTSSTSLHTLSTQDGDEEGASQSNTSDTDTEPFVDVLSPSPTHVVSRRRSFRNHDLFAASHISFSELGNLVALPDESH